MKKILNIFIFLIPLLQAALLWFGIFFDMYFFYFIVGAFLMSDVLLYLFIPKKMEKIKVFVISFPPLALLLAVGATLFFLEGNTSRLSVIVIHTVLQLLYGARMVRYIYKEGYPEVFFTETVSTILLASYFFFSFSFYAIIYFLEIPIWYLLGPFLLLTFLFFVLHIWMRGYAIRDHILALAAYSVLIMEALLVIRWLPSFYHVNAMLITALYFTIVSIGCGSLKKEVSRVQKILTVILVSVVVVLVMVTTQWR
jgi:hypothetical protein